MLKNSFMRRIKHSRADVITISSESTNPCLISAPKTSAVQTIFNYSSCVSYYMTHIYSDGHHKTLKIYS